MALRCLAFALGLDDDTRVCLEFIRKILLNMPIGVRRVGIDICRPSPKHELVQCLHGLEWHLSNLEVLVFSLIRTTNDDLYEDSKLSETRDIVELALPVMKARGILRFRSSVTYIFDEICI